MEKKSEGSVKLVGFWMSPFVHRVRWALDLKGIEYEYIEEDIFNKSSILSELNPVYGKVPVLVHDGKSLSESLTILEYIDETWNDQYPLLPLDPYERAQARFWAKFSEEKLMISVGLATFTEGEKQEGAVKLSIEALEKIEQILKGKKFFGGDKIGYLDLLIGYLPYMLPVWEEVASVKILDPLTFPSIAIWMDNFLHHEVIKAGYLPSKAEMVRFFEWRRQELIPVYASYQLQTI